MNVGTFKLRVGKSLKAVVLDEEKIPKEFLLPQKPKVNFKDLREHLKIGEKINGAALVESEYDRSFYERSNKIIKNPK
jgi:FAD synthase